MDRETAKTYIKDQLERYLQSKGIDPRKPFRCLNPDHRDKNPSMSIDRSSSSGLHCKCFSCGAYYSTLDLIGIDYGLTDTAAIFNKAYELFGLDIDNRKREQGERMKETIKAAITKPIIDDIEREREVTIDFTMVIKEAHEELLRTPQALQYLQGRGLSMEIINRYGLGYDALGYNHLLKDYPQHQTKSKKAGLYRYVFPYPDTSGGYNYFLTEIIDRSQIDEYNGKYRKIKKGDVNLSARIFNERYLVSPPSHVIFVCEGVYDALSVEEAGGKAIAFVGTADKRFLSLCKMYNPDVTFIISLDNDGAGQAATTRVKEGLDSLKIAYKVSTAEKGKDYNEALQTDRGAFEEYIAQTILEAEHEKKAADEEERETYLQTSAAHHLQGFLDAIEKSKAASYYPTGFQELDELLDGGLYAGLYTVGAISSLGKTTFCLQIIDQIAATGHDCLVFSLEMARHELMAKSISRHSLQIDQRDNDSSSHAKTVRGILTGSKYKAYSKTDLQTIEAAVNEYSQYAGHIYIHEGVGDIGFEEVRRKVEEHIKYTGNRPVVLLDYIQILAPYNDKATDKTNTDKAVLELKRLSRDYNIPIIGISSFNRDNYQEPVNLASFKESGAIEYSADVLIGLQYAGMDYEDGESKEVRAKRVRGILEDSIAAAKAGYPVRIQIKILKNRNGSKGGTVLDYYPMFNYFCSIGAGVQRNKGWAKSEGGKYSSSKAKKQPQTREAARAEFDAVFDRIKTDDNTANLTALADALEKSKTQIRNHVKEYGGYEVDTKADTIKRLLDDFSEVGEQEAIPFD